MTYLDTNVIVDLLDDGAEKHESCVEKLIAAKARGPVLIADIVYSEVSIAMSDEEEMSAALQLLAVGRSRPSDAALFSAGRAFQSYRNVNKGPKLNVLPDFLIGAQAEADGVPLVTSNSKDFAGYFPNLEIIAP